MMTVEGVVEQSVIALFAALEKAQLRYAVLRNYDNFPDFGHDVDLVLHHDDMSAWNNLLLELAEAYQWDVVQCCNHWGQSRHLHNQVHVFRLFQTAKPLALQIDLFHGYPSWGHALISEDELLETRILDERGFYRVSPAIENFFRILQLSTLSRLPSDKENEDKLERYRKKVDVFATSNPLEFNTLLSNYLPKSSVNRLLETIRQGDMKVLRKYAWDLKLNYLFKKLKTAPLQTISCFFERWQEQVFCHFFNPCGSVVKVYLENLNDYDGLSSVLTRLSESKLLYKWTSNSAHQTAISSRERKLLERGGWVIKWVSSKEAADICVSSAMAPDLLQSQLISFLLDKHRNLEGATITRVMEP